MHVRLTYVQYVAVVILRVSGEDTRSTQLQTHPHARAYPACPPRVLFNLISFEASNPNSSYNRRPSSLACKITVSTPSLAHHSIAVFINSLANPFRRYAASV